MKEHESLSKSSLRAFFVCFFAVVGITVALTAVGLAFYGMTTLIEEESFPSKVKIFSDAQGNRTKLSGSPPVILQITLKGMIGLDKLTGKHIEEVLLETHEDALKARVKAILLVINSPGGDVNDSDIMYRLLKRYKEKYKIPIYAFVDGLCASGGYYIACAADKIYASDVSLIGSIGAISWPPFMNVSDALEKIGIDTLTLSAGKGKDDLNPFRTWQPDEQKNRQSLINFFYNKFVDIVVSHRPIQKETLVQEYGARVYPPPEALTLGFIDGQNYSRSEVLAALAEAAKIEQRYQVVGFETESWWKKWLQEGAKNSPLWTGKITHEFSLPCHKGYPFSYIYIP